MFIGEVLSVCPFENKFLIKKKKKEIWEKLSALVSGNLFGRFFFSDLMIRLLISLQIRRNGGIDLVLFSSFVSRIGWFLTQSLDLSVVYYHCMFNTGMCNNFIFCFNF